MLHLPRAELRLERLEHLERGHHVAAQLEVLGLPHERIHVDSPGAAPRSSGLDGSAKCEHRAPGFVGCSEANTINLRHVQLIVLNMQHLIASAIAVLVTQSHAHFK